MDRKDFSSAQLVTEADMDAAFAQPEAQFWDTHVDLALFGVCSGLTPSLGASPTVDITKGIAYDQLGRRVKAYSDGTATKNHSYATTTAGAATSVTAGQERWISVFAKWGRKLSVPLTDADGNTVQFQVEEVVNSDGTPAGVDKFFILAGTSAPTGTASRPPLQTDCVLVCDIKRTPSDASNVLDTSRRQLGPFSAATTAIAIAALTNWAGGRTNPATTLNPALDKIVTDFASTTAGDDGMERVGAQASGTMPAGSARSQADFLDTSKASLTADQTWSGEQLWSRPTPATDFVHKYAQTAGFRLIWGVDGASSTDGGVRAYIEGNGRLYLTTNARWDGTNWNKDVTTRESMALVVGAISGATKHHALLCWRLVSASTWANTFGISTGWDRILDFSGTDADFIGGSGSGLGAGVGTTLFEVQKGEMIGNVNSVASDNYWIGLTGYRGTANNLQEIQGFRRKWNATPTAGTVTADATLIADLGTSPAIALDVINSIAFSFHVSSSANPETVGKGARVTFSRP